MWRMLMGGRRRLRRWWTMGIVVVVLAALVVVAVTGSREPAAAVRLVPGTAWLEDAATGAVSHVFGYSATADAPVPTGSAHDPFTVVQEADGAYVLDERTGVLRRLGGTSIGVATQRTLTGTPSGLRVLTTGTTTWSVDTRSGIAQQLNPTSLAPIGHQVPIGASLGDVITDSSGTLWAVVPSRGAVAKVQPGGGLDNIDVGRVGDQVQLADTQSGVWAVDGSLHEMLPIDGQQANPAPIPSTTTRPVVASSAGSPQLVAVTGDTATDLDTGSGAVTQTSTPGLTAVDQGVIANNQAYLLAPAEHAVDILGLDPTHAETTVQVPAGADQLIAQDRMVFVNATNAPDAAVIDASGHLTPIVKYQAPTKGNGNRPAVGNNTTAVKVTPVPTPTPRGPVVTTPPAAPPTTPPTTPALPGRPTDVFARSTSAGQLAVTWQPGAGPAPAHYDVLLSPSAGGPTISLSATGTSATATGLADGTSYCPQVQAVSASGTGSGYTAGPCSDTAVRAPTTQPTGLTVEPSNRTVIVTFGAAPDADPGTSYAVTITATATGKPMTTTEPKAGTYSLPAPVTFPADTSSEYGAVSVTVTAANNAGSGPASGAVSSYEYQAGADPRCAHATYESYFGAVCGTGEAQVGTQPFALISTNPEKPQLPGAGALSMPVNSTLDDAALCVYPGAPMEDEYRVAAAATPTTCPTVPSVNGNSFTGEYFAIVWLTPANTHNVKVVLQPVTFKDLSGTPQVEDLVMEPSEDPQTVAGPQSAVTPVPGDPIATFYADPANT